MEASQRRTILNIFMKQSDLWEPLGFSEPSLTSSDMTVFFLTICYLIQVMAF